ncbi:phospholipase D-like protein [Nonomuraea polychroma]|uniref:phospholipase D n=1 Tax=Nonomuraea polychroma TaxID=46176 RepID=A0A438MAL2_9ACTN|nr:DISARM system phospholipase D-like protein DrmC [Nonomuraea polychroma]RVX42769.1 phospholipase D-like protein [Nonomuraea polychroma]
MNGYPRLARAAAEAVAQLGPSRLRTLAERIGAGWPRAAIPGAVPVPGFAEHATAILDARDAESVPDLVAATYLVGVADGHAQHAGTTRADVVWSGPSSHGVPVRATAQVLVDVVAEATRELLLMTYSAKPYPPLLEALAAAVRRGVTVAAVVETLQGAGSALSGSEPATAFTSVPGIELWHWPAARRTTPGSKMHAKLAVADRRILLVSSANLTQSGVSRNIEAGLLITGGTAPQRAAEHIAELRAHGVLERLR